MPEIAIEQARQTLAFLPVLRRWVGGRLQIAGADCDLSMRQYAALRAIRDGAISPGELARQWQVTPAVVTGVVDRLERRGLVRREVDPVDRRRLRLALTAAGETASEEVERALIGELAAQLATASTEELVDLGRALDLLQRTFAALDAREADITPPCPSGAMPNRDERGAPLRSHEPNREDGTMATSPASETQTKTADAPNGNGIGASAAATESVALNLTDPQFMATAYDTYAKLREEGRVAHVTFGGGEDSPEAQKRRGPFFGRESLFVSHFDDVVATLLDDRFSVDPRARLTGEQREEEEIPEEFRPLARSIISIDPPDHTRIRKLVQPTFTGRTMEAMRPGIQKIVDDLLDRAEREAAARGETAPNRRMELVRSLAYPFPVTVISDLLGIPREDRGRIRGWTENLLRADRGRDQALNDEVRAGLREFSAYLTELFARKRREPADDMISRMVLAEEDDEVLTEEEVLATTFLMYLAGHVTTVNLVGNGVVALLTHPEQLAKLRQDPSLAKNVVEETLRYWGPVDFIGRRFATRELEVAGAPVARGENVTVGLAAANRDPDRFAHPDVYDITRADANRHVAFGKGIHVCLGAPLARVEGQVAFATLARRYPDLRLAAPVEEIRWGGSFLRGFREIPLLF